MGNDRFPTRIEDLRLSNEALSEILEGCQKAQRQPKLAKPGTYACLPYERMLEVCGWRDASAAVLVELAYRAFRTHNAEVPLPNKGALKFAGVNHAAKGRALRRLEEVGLVKVDWRGGKRTPLVTVLWDFKHAH